MGVDYLLLHLMRLVQDIEYNKKTKPTTILKFSKLVSESISKNLTVKEYANQLYLTVEKLNELCKESYGENPKKIILEKKNNRSKTTSAFHRLICQRNCISIRF